MKQAKLIMDLASSKRLMGNSKEALAQIQKAEGTVLEHLGSLVNGLSPFKDATANRYKATLKKVSKSSRMQAMFDAKKPKGVDVLNKPYEMLKDIYKKLLEIDVKNELKWKKKSEDLEQAYEQIKKAYDSTKLGIEKAGKNYTKSVAKMEQELAKVRDTGIEKANNELSSRKIEILESLGFTVKPK